MPKTFRHLDGCPVSENPDELAHRIESFTAERPKGAGTVWITRCIECGADTVADSPPEREAKQEPRRRQRQDTDMEVANA